MNAYVKLILLGFIPVAAAAIFWLLDGKTGFGKMKFWVKQVIIGLVFGGIAIIGTEFGVPINGAQVNCRDAAVLVAGLMFGGPAGIIAGVIGGVERWFAVYWGVGVYTRVACSVSTVLAGFYAAALRRFIFRFKRPEWITSFVIGLVMEVFHMLMVFVTHMDSPEEAIVVVRNCTGYMLLANGIAVFLASIVLTFLDGKKFKLIYSNFHISTIIEICLLITFILVFVLSSGIVYSFQQRLSKTQTDNTLEYAIDEVGNEINAIVNENAEDISMANWLIAELSAQRHVGQSGFVAIFDSEEQPLAMTVDRSMKEILDPDNSGSVPEQGDVFTVGIDGEMFFAQYSVKSEYSVFAFIAEEEATETRDISVFLNCFLEILVFALLYGMIYMLIQGVAVRRLNQVNESLAKISDGNLDEKVDIRTNVEFDLLSNGINTTVDSLKKYIKEASERIDAELSLAKNIQASALPNVFPAFPKRSDIDIFASMDAAKEVGGDFYDFYITDGDTLNFLIADVSGKGIPAAMFMMRAKTELKTLTESGIPLSEVFEKGNNALCEGNDAGMFVTAWHGSLNLETGLLTYVNAGHNPPLLGRSDGGFEYLKSRSGLVMAGMENVKYRVNTVQLAPGDRIFLYTDGVTEAINTETVLFGEERLLEALNAAGNTDARGLCAAVREKLDAFVGGAEQFDDITMLAVEFKGGGTEHSIHFDNATIENIPETTDFVEEKLAGIGAGMKVISQINIVIDEIFSNIVNYGYAGKTGPVTVTLIHKESTGDVYIRFEDHGMPYNPLSKADPDVTLSAEERQIGGLGIFIVKQIMDEIKYKYEDETNIFTVRKNIFADGKGKIPQ